MAKMLRRRYRLMVLVVRLVTDRRDGDRVELALERASGDEIPFAKWSLSLDAQKISENLLKGRGDVSGTMVRKFFSTVAADVNRLLDRIGHAGPLWIHLVKPYGMLGGIAWEKLLREVSHPLLRLPDALAGKPVASPNKLNVVLCAGLARCSAIDAARSIVVVAQSILSSFPELPVKIWLFVNPDYVTEVNKFFTGWPHLRVLLVDPAAWPDYDEENPSEESISGATGLLHPWLAWMEWRMSEVEVDVVHFLCDGYLAGDGGQIGFPGTPHDRSALMPLVSAVELNRFVLRLGAWSVAFTSPTQNPSALGLRVLCDRFAQTRPGPVLYHALKDDRSGRQLAQAYAFLYRSDYTYIPIMPAISLCCQPQIVADCARRVHGEEFFPPPDSAVSSKEAVIDFSTPFQITPDMVTARASGLRSEEPNDELGFQMPSVLEARQKDLEIGSGGFNEQMEDNPRLPAVPPPTPAPEQNQMQAEIPAWFGPGQRFVESKLFELRLAQKSRSEFPSQESPEMAGTESGIKDIQAAVRSLVAKGIL